LIADTLRQGVSKGACNCKRPWLSWVHNGRKGGLVAEHPDDSVGERAARVVGATHDIGSFIRALREEAQVSLRQLAQMAGVSNPYLSQIERGLRNPSAEVLTQIAKGLRVSSEALYIRAGLLEQRLPSPVREALLTDADLNERQKQVLLDIYDSFRRENAAAGSTGSGDPAMAGAAAQPPTPSPTDQPMPTDQESQP
jgi:transcriptional regulator with XRE-family HTH domain